MGHLSTISLKDMIVLVWAGLQKKHADAVEEPSEAGEVIDEVLAHTGDVSALMDTIAEAVNDAVPMRGKDEAEGGGSPNARKGAAKGRQKKPSGAGTQESTGDDSSE